MVDRASRLLHQASGSAEIVTSTQKQYDAENEERCHRRRTYLHDRNGKADEMVGRIDDTNLIRNTISVGDKIFSMAPQNTVGPRIGELKKGDQVRIFYAADRVRSQTRFNAVGVEQQAD